MPQRGLGHVVVLCDILQKNAPKALRTRVLLRKLRYRLAYSHVCIYQNEYRPAFGSRFRGLPHHNPKHRAHLSSHCCLLGRIPMESTMGGLSLSTNGGSKPYYWVLSRVGLILVARRENPLLSHVPGSFCEIMSALCAQSPP